MNDWILKISGRLGFARVLQNQVLHPLILVMVMVMTNISCTSKPETQTQGAKATFAGGCFWCMETAFDQLEGVLSTTSGYTGGTTENPTYKQVCTGNTGHAEALEINYDPDKITYARLLETFWHNIDPADNSGQFCDKGSQYRTAIFYHDEEQKSLAEASKQALIESKRCAEVFTEIVAASTFYPAEEYHQGYHVKNPMPYRIYKDACGRDQRIEELWGRVVPQKPESSPSIPPH
jgi:peptide-methionine (S)-S-oxide reductase